MTDSRETTRRKQFRDHAAAAADPPDEPPARRAGRLPYVCPSCGRQRETTADQRPKRCPTCILDDR